MKDFDEYDDYSNDEDTPRSRAMSWVVLSVALAGFVALAWYAYHSGSKSIQEGQMVVIKADETPIKEKPVDAGGEEFPHQDKTIYDTISPYRAQQTARVEKLLPEPEEPVVEQPANADTKTWVNEKLRQVSDAEEKINAQLEASESKKEVAVAAPTPKALAPKVVATMAGETPKHVTPAPVAVVKQQETTAAAPVIKPAVPAPVPAAATAGGGFKIQLGAFGSDAEAKQNWSRISNKHAAILSGHVHTIMQAVVNGKTVYRLRASGFSTADAAKAACAKLTAAGQACFFAGK